MMYSFLPDIYKSALRKEYIVRFLTIFFCAIAAALLIGDLTLVPSLVLLKAKKTELNQKLEEINRVASTSAFAQASGEIVKTNTLLKNVSLPVGSLPQIIMETALRKNGGIHIKEFAISQGTSTYMLDIRGVSDTREYLSNFKKSLEMDQNITKVELPVSDLAKSRDISFAIKVTGNINKK